MSTVVRRCFASIPARDAHQTWEAVVDLLTRGKTGAARDELMGVAGIAASVIGDQAPLDAPIIATCDGPRTRIYCLYDDNALDGSDASEEALGFDPLNGDWALSLPCLTEDLDWVKAALKARSKRITARDVADGLTKPENTAATASSGLVFDQKGFLGS